jgi:NAD(P)-dependent dehydrogenase (short-subunit alcohol dehydrogenase family)
VARQTHDAHVEGEPLATELRTDTELVRESIDRIVATTGRSPDEALAELVRSNPQRRLVLPTEVADAVAWLCSPGSSAITGQSVPVAGGEVM